MAGWFPGGFWSEYWADEYWPEFGTAANWTDASYKMSAKLEVQWDGSNWTDESANLLAASGKQAMLQLWQMAGGVAAQPPWDASFAMSNDADRYSATNTSSPIYSYIADNKGHGIPIRFSMGIDDGDGGFTYTRVFTGQIDRIDVISTRDDRVTFTCIDNALPLLQRKVTTTMSLNQRADDWLTVLASEANVAATDFDAGFFEIPFCWCDDENSWTQMCLVAYADCGHLFFDLNGTLTFENAEAWAGDARHNTSQHTFTVSRFKDMGLAFDWSNCYNEVIIEYSPRAQIGQVVLYELDEVVQVLPGATRSDVIARLRSPSPTINAPVSGADYHVVSDAGDDMSEDLSIALTKYAQRVELELENTHSYLVAWLYRFRLTGRPLQGYKALEIKLQASDSDIGDPSSADAKTLRISGNDYIQLAEQAMFVASILRDRIKKARQIYPIKDVPAIPTLQPGDRVTVVESGSEINNEGFIQSITWRYNGRQYRADYEVIDATSWFLNNDYFEMDSDVLAPVTSEKVFY
jgi:hypothetical protein